jgi:hypothetical protein
MASNSQCRWRISCLAALGAMLAGTLFAPSAAAVPGLQRVTYTEPPNTNVRKDYVAQCPAGKKAIGGGGYITGAFGRAHLFQLQPTEAVFGVTAFEDEAGYDGAWSLTAIAYCASPLAGLEYKVAGSARGSGSSRSVTVQCPVGKKVIGTGSKIDFFGGGAFAPAEVILDGVAVNPALTQVTATGHEDDTGYGGEWGVNAWAVCANEDVLPGLQRVAVSSPFNSISPKSATAICPAGKPVHGGGGAISNGAGEVILDDVHPGTTSVAATGYEDLDGYSGNWSVTAYAICAS